MRKRIVIPIKCENCGKDTYSTVLPIIKNVDGVFRHLYVCQDCYRSHKESFERRKKIIEESLREREKENG